MSAIFPSFPCWTNALFTSPRHSSAQSTAAIAMRRIINDKTTLNIRRACQTVQLRLLSTSPLPSSPPSPPPPQQQPHEQQQQHDLTPDVLFLYRYFIRQLKILPDEALPQLFPSSSSSSSSSSPLPSALSALRSRFRADCSSSRENSYEQRIAMIKHAYQRAAFIRMSISRIHHIPFRPPASAFLARDVHIGGQEEGEEGEGGGVQRYFYDGGEMIGHTAKPRQTQGISNSQGITDEQLKRHYALVERMHFRGPYWEGKPKY